MKRVKSRGGSLRMCFTQDIAPTQGFIPQFSNTKISSPPNPPNSRIVVLRLDRI